MFLEEYALSILHSGSLSSKLASPEIVELGLDGLGSSFSLSEFKVPEKPNRLTQFQASQLKSAKLKPSQLTGTNLGNEMERAQLLHSFANHELQAIELFAWAILRFPQAPAEFRRGLLRVIGDEQKHFKLYEQRMNQFGFQFGDFPVNDFMWKVLTKSATLEQFTAAMSLSFEQANLDFACFYRDAFARAGDMETSEVLNIVLHDEIQHVRHGVTWSDKWKEEGQTLLEFHEQNLVFPLTLARARGSFFREEPRQKAGFPEGYISELRTFSASKGRPPRVFYFNPESERENLYAKGSFNSTAGVEALRRDLAPLLMFIAKPEDVVLVDQRPHSDFLYGLSRRGYDPCAFLSGESSERCVLEVLSRYKHLSELQPWGWSPKIRSNFAPLKDRLQKGSECLPWFEVLQDGKLFAHQLRRAYPWRLDSLSKKIEVFTDLESLQSRINALQFEFVQNNLKESIWVLKAPLGSSGHQQLKIDLCVNLSAVQLGWVAHVIKLQKAVILEPWVRKVMDLSVVGTVDRNGITRPWGVSRFITNERGHYLGTCLGHPYYGVSRELTRAFNSSLAEDGNQSEVKDRLLRSAVWVGSQLYQKGYFGPFGVDSFLYYADEGHDPTKVELRSIVEVNIRWTMGHIAHEIGRKYKASKNGQWCHLHRSKLHKLGFVSFLDFSEQMKLRYGDDYFETNDPAIANEVLSFVCPEPFF